MQHFSAQPDETTAIAPYTQDGYRQLCERLDDDTVAALLHAHIRAFAAAGSCAAARKLRPQSGTGFTVGIVMWRKYLA